MAASISPLLSTDISDIAMSRAHVCDDEWHWFALRLVKKGVEQEHQSACCGHCVSDSVFSDFAWPHDVVDSNDTRALSNYEWKITSDSMDVSIPRFSYLPANLTRAKKLSLSRTIQVVQIGAAAY